MLLSLPFIQHCSSRRQPASAAERAASTGTRTCQSDRRRFKICGVGFGDRRRVRDRNTPVAAADDASISTKNRSQDGLLQVIGILLAESV